MAGNNSGSGFTGSVTVAGGILEAAAPNSLPSNLTVQGVQGGATLAVAIDGSGDGGGGSGDGPWTQSQIATLRSSGCFEANAILGIDTGESVFSLTGLANTASGPLGFVVLGNGTLILTGTNTYTGGTTILGGTLVVSSAANLGNAGATITLNGGTLQVQASGDFQLVAPIVLGPDGGTIDLDGSSAEFSGQITGSGGLTVIDSSTEADGTLTLNNASDDNDYTGGTDLESGKLIVGSGNALGSSASGLLINGGTLDLSGNAITVASLSGTGGTITSNSGSATLTVAQGSDTGNYTFQGNLQDGNGGSLALDYSGSGSLTLGGAIDLSGQIQIEAGSTLIIGDGASLSADTDIANNGTLEFANSGSLNVAGTISGTGNVVAGGSGLLEFSGTNNSWSNGTTIAAGMVQFNSGSLPSAAPASILIESGGALEASGPYATAAGWIGSGLIDPNSSGALALTADESAIDLTDYASLSIGAAENVTFDGTITTVSGAYNLGGGPGTLTVDTPLTGGNSLVINGNVVLASPSNDYTGGTVINAGTLQVGSVAYLGAAAAPITFNGGTLQAAASLYLTAPIAVGPNGGTFDTDGLDSAVAATIAGSGALTVIDSTGSGGTLDLSNADASGFSGSLILGSGLVVADGGGNLGSPGNSAIIFNGGALRAGNSFAIAAGQEIDVLAGGATFDANGYTLAIAASLVTIDGGDTSGAAGAVTVIDSSSQGSGVVRFSGDNLFQGATVSSGTLVVASPGGLADGAALTVGDWGSSISSGDSSSQTGQGMNALGPGSLGDDSPTAPNDPGPLVSLILCVDPTLIDADSVDFTVTFDEPVTGVTTADFGLVAAGPIATVAAVSGSGSQYTVTVDVTGSGTLGLSVLAGGTIVDAVGTPLAGASLASQQYIIDRQLYWDASGGWGPEGGSGAWDSGTNWHVGSPTGPLQGFCDGSNVILAGTPGTISIGNSAEVASITVVSDGYVIEGAPISLMPSPPAPLPSTGEGSVSGTSRSSTAASTGEGSGSDTAPSSTAARTGEGSVIDVAVGTLVIDCDMAGGPLVKSGGGTLQLAGTNSYSVSTTVSNGTLQLQNGSLLPAGTALDVDGGTVDLGGATSAGLTTVTLAGGSIVDGGLEAGTAYNLSSGTVLADLSGPAGLDKTGSYTVVLAGNDSYQGGTDAAQGTLIAMYQDSLPGTATGSGTVIVQPTLYWSGDGDWTSGQWELAGGATTPWIDGSSIVVAAGSEINLSGTVTVGSITFQGNATITGGTLSLPSWGSTISVLAGAATIDSAFAGGGNGGLAQSGRGELVLGGALGYTGPTTVAGGTLDLLSPLATAPLLAGGQAIGPGALFGTAGTSLYAQDPAMFNLVESLFADQAAINRADMIQILDSAVVDGAVSSAALRALETVTLPQNEALLKMPNYVAVLAADVVQGNPANASYQGQPLGNLADQGTAALRATALADLVGKWFYGTDLPAASEPYCVVAGSLFGDNPNPALDVPSSADMAQGGLGDCYLIAALGAIADSSPSAIANMFIPNGVENGMASWTVRFYYATPQGYSADYVTVNALLPGYWYGSLCYARPGANDSFWMPLVEKAYAEWNETGREGRDGRNAYASLVGGDMAAVDDQVLGCAAATYFPTAGSPAEAAVIDAIQNNEAVAAAIFGAGPQFSALNLVSDHAYEVTGYDPVSQTFQLENPWGYAEPAPLTWNDLCSFCGWLNVAGADGTAPAGGAVADQAIIVGESPLAANGGSEASGQMVAATSPAITGGQGDATPAAGSNAGGFSTASGRLGGRQAMGTQDHQRAETTAQKIQTQAALEANWAAVDEVFATYE
jgi:autotransporter-associated beta strand protein